MDGGLTTVSEAGYTHHAGAACAAEVRAGGLHAVADNLAPTVLAAGSEGVDGALKAIEDVGGSLPSHRNLERLVVLVPADFAHSQFTTSVPCAEAPQ